MEEAKPEKIYEFPIQGEVNKLPIHPDMSLRSADTTGNTKITTQKIEIFKQTKQTTKSDFESEDRKPFFELPLDESNKEEERWEDFLPENFKRFSTEMKTEKFSVKPDYKRFQSMPDRFEEVKLARSSVRAALIEEDAQAEIYKVKAETLPDTEISANLCEVTIMSKPITGASTNKITLGKYILRTMPLDWTVERETNDFYWLRDILARTFPGVYVPPRLPKRFTTRNVMDTNRKDQRFLTRFMKNILSHPLLSRSLYLVHFLKENDNLKYNLFKTQTSTFREPSTTDELPSLEGFVWINPSTSQDHTERLRDYVNSAIEIQRRIKRQANKLEKQLHNTSELMLELKESMNDMERLQMLSQTNLNVEIFRALQGVLGTLAKSDEKRAVFVKDHISTLFKFTYNESIPFRDLIKDRERHLNKYQKENRRLRGKKEKLWNNGDILKWELDPSVTNINVAAMKSDKEVAIPKMLHQETKDVEKLKDRYGYHNYKLREETMWFIPFTTRRNIMELETYANKEIKSHTKLKSVWVEFIDRLNKIDEQIK
ncbi:unnamed protein product [Blepharisma stoltei]|uniref:PX domain-containing protein n=1 Tax=Blepharisma stoltei TaxID=1481888 RepID=A0AAU9IUH1_9CILI|nr:unnamed protein product [Blepharisma stoltei]